MVEPSSSLHNPLSSEFIVPTNKDINAKLRSDGGKRLRFESFEFSSGVCIDGQITYLCGNSLGLLSQRSNTLVQEELGVWAKR